MTPNERLLRLSRAGVSVWLDDLSREMISSGRLASLVATRSVVGVTTNPAIFESALSDAAAYGNQIRALAAAGAAAEEAVQAMTIDDVRDACHQLVSVYDATDGIDGRVSIEVDPRLAYNTEATVAQAAELYRMVGRPNLLIKVPATDAGLPAITRILAHGISVNVTLIFSVDRYLEVIDAYLDGLEFALQNGHDLATVHSVASFFVSRVDTEIDTLLDALGTPEALALKGRAALANARRAYATYQQVFGNTNLSDAASGSPPPAASRFARLSRAGARPQRPLWASTGTKNSAYPDTMYVSELVAPGTVNTVPPDTLEAFADHGWLNEQSFQAGNLDSLAIFDALVSAGVDLADVFKRLESEGVTKFERAWSSLLRATAEQLAHAGK